MRRHRLLLKRRRKLRILERALVDRRCLLVNVRRRILSALIDHVVGSLAGRACASLEAHRTVQNSAVLSVESRGVTDSLHSFV